MSRLASKLSKLRSQAGQLSGAIVDGSTFRAEFERRTLARGVRQQSPRREIVPQGLASLVGGREVEEGLTVIERRIPVSELHGAGPIASGLAQALSYFDYSDAKPLFLDTETTGLAGGTGTMVFLVGLMKLVGDELEFAQCLLTRFQGESALLDYTARFARETDLLVSYNGKSFDLPLLATRFRLAGIQNPFETYPHLDLLHATRRAFRRVWPDCTLRSAERRLIGFERVDDLPGSMAPQVWFDWIREQRVEQMPGVVEHNALDVLSMSALTCALHGVYAQPAERLIDHRGVARYLSMRLGDGEAYEYLLAHRPQLDVESALELARLARRRRHWQVAVESWRPLAAKGHTQAIECLAKYYEHIVCDLTSALQFTETLLEIDGACERYAQRHRRLLGKAAASP